MESKEQNVSAAVPSMDSVVTTEHIDTDPSAYHEADILSETVRDFSENADMRTTSATEESAVHSTAVLHNQPVPAEPFDSCEAMPSSAVPQDEVKCVTVDIIPVEGTLQCLECVPGHAVAQQEDVFVKTEPINMALTANDSLQQKADIESQHRPTHAADCLQSEATIATNTALHHEAQCTNAVLQCDSVSTNDEVEQKVAPAVDELSQEISLVGTVLQNEATSNVATLKQISDDDNLALQGKVEIGERNKELEEPESRAGIVISSVEVCEKDQMDSVLSTTECNEVSLQDTGTNATTADTQLEVAVTVDHVMSDDSASVDFVSDSSATESPDVCDKVAKPEHFVPAESSPRTSDSLDVCNSQDVADEDSTSACPERTDESCAADKGCIRPFLY